MPDVCDTRPTCWDVRHTRRARRVLGPLPLLLAAVALLVAPGAAHACSCISFDPARVDDADAAIVGRATAIVDPEDRGAQYKVTRIEVSASNSPEIGRGDTVDVESSSSGASCGLELEVGQEAGLLLDEYDGTWSGSLCNTTSVEVMEAAIGADPGVEGVEGPRIGFLGWVRSVVFWFLGIDAAQQHANMTGAPVDVTISSDEGPAVPPCIAARLRAA